MSKHSIDFFNTFEIREPVLKKLNIGYNVIPGTKEIIFDRPLHHMSAHEKDAVNFVLNPLATIELLAGQNNEVAIEIVKSLKTIYLDKNGSWD